MGAIYGFCGEALAGNAGRLLERMAATLSFRGQEQASSVEGAVGLGAVKHAYESGPRVVIDRERGVVAVCEGEIYNAAALRRGLKNPPGADAADAGGFELIPSLYREQGQDFARNINGVFGIALWDQAGRKLLLVRDHLGSHSLFYSLGKEVFSFATTVAALFATGVVSRELSTDSLDRYFGALAISPPETIFQEVMAVRPGHVLVYENGRAAEFSYWPVEAIREERGRSSAEFAEELRALFEDAVAIRAAAGGRCGALVSGGVDTSAVIAALHKSGKSAGLEGFSVAFAEEAFSDAHLQEIIYRTCGVARNNILLSPAGFVEGLEQGAAFLDCPVNDPAYAGMYIAFRAAAGKGCQAVFEGEGSDEIFCTGHSRGEFDIQKYLVLPFSLRKIIFGPFVASFSEGSSFKDKVVRKLARLGMTDLQRRSTWIPVFSPATRRRLLGRSGGEGCDILSAARYYYGNTRLEDMLNIYQYGLTRIFLADDLLFKNERMAAAAGIVNRTPFIDHRLVEAAFRIPARYKMAQASEASDGTKLIFKQAARGLVPDAILDRKKKRGFSQPTAVWYHNELKPFVHERLMGGDARLASRLDHGEVKRICLDFLEGRIGNDYFVNSLLILELWLRKHT